MSITRRALWIIERNLDRDLSLGGIASATGVSAFHLAHAFGRTTGMGLVAYLRARRLSEAARRLVAGEADILGLALDTGYGSHEAFSRAFKAQFGVTPEAARKSGTIGGLALVEPFRLADTTEALVMTPRIVSSGPIKAVGLAEIYRFGRFEGIPAQWRRFRAGIGAIANRTPAIPLSIARKADDIGTLEYIAAAEVSEFGAMPDGFISVDLPARRYAVFEHGGHVSALPETYARIWDTALPASGLEVADAPSLERHLPTFDPATGLGGITIWIALA